jgi:hypothetical protein
MLLSLSTGPQRFGVDQPFVGITNMLLPRRDSFYFHKHVFDATVKKDLPIV